ncbi:MAG: AzlC family ABC transporter permease [Clostridia bacterium]|nr:AzlC family ABC transporter permease [Clostridia bacterium]
MSEEHKQATAEGKLRALRAAFPHTIPVLMGFLVLGLAYGWLMKTKGYGVLWSVIASMFCFGGSMQFVMITLLTLPFRPLSAFIMSILVNARHLFYGISMLDKFKGLGKARFFLIFWLCDETYSIEAGVEPPENVDRKYFYLFISLLDYCYWVVGTALGGILGGLLTINTAGLDFALTALFVVLLVEQLRKRENWLPCLMAAASTMVMLLLFGADSFVIPAMALILALLLLTRSRLEAALPPEEGKEAL